MITAVSTILLKESDRKERGLPVIREIVIKDFKFTIKVDGAAGEQYYVTFSDGKSSDHTGVGRG